MYCDRIVITFSKIGCFWTGVDVQESNCNLSPEIRFKKIQQQFLRYCTSLQSDNIHLLPQPKKLNRRQENTTLTQTFCFE